MPNRIIRDGINDSLRVNALPQLTELFYRKLQLLVDDYGRYEAEPLLLRAKLYGLRPEVSVEEVCEHLRALASIDNPLIVLYEVNSKKYLEIQGFGQRTRTEKFPAPALASKCGQPRARASNTNTRSPTNTNTQEGSAEGNPKSVVDAALDSCAIAIHARHPSPRRDIGASEVRTKLRKILSFKKLRGDEGASYLDDLMERHGKFCLCEQWTNDGGEFAKGLSNWLAPRLGRYEQEPPPRASPNGKPVRHRMPDMFSTEEATK